MRLLPQQLQQQHGNNNTAATAAITMRLYIVLAESARNLHYTPWPTVAVCLSL